MFENHSNVSFNIASEASYVYIFCGQKVIKNTKNGPIWRVFEKWDFLRIFRHCVKAHHLCCCINISNLHLMGSWTVLLDPVPSELMARHWYKPLSCRLTFCKTRLWLVMITPSSRLYFNSLPFLVQTIVCGVGLECIRHSKYTSSPSLMLDAFKLRPKRSSAWGASEVQNISNS